MSFVDGFVGPSVDAIYLSYPTYASLGLDGRVTPYQVLPSRVNRLPYGSLTLSESASETGSEGYGSSGIGDAGRLAHRMACTHRTMVHLVKGSVSPEAASCRCVFSC